MAKAKRPRRRRDTKYAPITGTINPKGLARLNKIARNHFPNRSAALERAVDLLIDHYPNG